MRQRQPSRIRPREAPQQGTAGGGAGHDHAESEAAPREPWRLIHSPPRKADSRRGRPLSRPLLRAGRPPGARQPFTPATSHPPERGSTTTTREHRPGRGRPSRSRNTLTLPEPPVPPLWQSGSSQAAAAAMWPAQRSATLGPTRCCPGVRHGKKTGEIAASNFGRNRSVWGGCRNTSDAPGFS